MKKTINQLIEDLEDLRHEIAQNMSLERDEDAGDAEIEIAEQPNYPLCASIAALTAMPYQGAPTGFRVYIAAGPGTEYGNSRMWEGGLLNDDDEEENA